MLAEWLTYLTARCSPLTRDMGYLREAIAIRARHRRCRAAWQPHLEQSQSVLLATLPSGRRDTALVLGSGLLLDVPLAELSRAFREVWLVDAVHLPAVRRQAARWGNVVCIDHDVTECGEDLRAANFSLESLNGLASRVPSRFLDLGGVDWVASVNMLSQLPLLPLAWIERHLPSLDDAFLQHWGREVMRRHLEYLRAFGAPVCLLADAEQAVCDASGTIVEHSRYEADLGFEDTVFASWRWDVAPKGELGDGKSAWHRVVACKLK